MRSRRSTRRAVAHRRALTARRSAAPAAATAAKTATRDAPINTPTSTTRGVTHRVVSRRAMPATTVTTATTATSATTANRIAGPVAHRPGRKAARLNSHHAPDPPADPSKRNTHHATNRNRVRNTASRAVLGLTHDLTRGPTHELQHAVTGTMPRERSPALKTSLAMRAISHRSVGKHARKCAVMHAVTCAVMHAVT
jgi:hypothetical protein